MGNNNISDDVMNSLSDDAGSNIIGTVEEIGPNYLLEKKSKPNPALKQKEIIQKDRKTHYEEFSKRNGVYMEINDVMYRVFPGKSIAQVLYELNFKFLSLCYFPGLNRLYEQKNICFEVKDRSMSSCLCHVFIRVDVGDDFDYEFGGLRYKFLKGCETFVKKGMSIITYEYSEMRNKMREFFDGHISLVMKKLFKAHPNCKECLYEPKLCELHRIFEEFRRKRLFFDNEEFEDSKSESSSEKNIVDSNLSKSFKLTPLGLEFDKSRCIGCRRCMLKCETEQGLITKLLSLHSGKNKKSKKEQEEIEGEEEIEEFNEDSDELESLLKNCPIPINLKSLDPKPPKKNYVDLEDFFFRNILMTPNCSSCGGCTLVCPNAVIRESQQFLKLLEYLKSSKESNASKKICLISPASRIMFYQYFGTLYRSKKRFEKREGTLITFLRSLGFDYIYDLSLGSDLYLREFIQEFQKRSENLQNLVMISSHCLAIKNLIHRYYPKYSKNLSTLKTPSEILANFLRNFEFKNSEVSITSIIPCIAKKSIKSSDLDFLITSRELIRIGISLEFEKNLHVFSKDWKTSRFDGFGRHMKTKDGISRNFASRGGFMFEVTGGITEAFLSHFRIKEKVITSPHLRHFNVHSYEYQISSPQKFNFRCVVCHGSKNLLKLIEMFDSQKAEIINEKLPVIVEAVACQGGCCGGGGGLKFEKKEKIYERYRLLSILGGKNRDVASYYCKENSVKNETSFLKYVYSEKFLKAPFSETSRTHFHCKN